MTRNTLLQCVSKGLSGLSFLLLLCVAMTRAVAHCVGVECVARLRGARRKNAGSVCENEALFHHKLFSHG